MGVSSAVIGALRVNLGLDSAQFDKGAKGAQKKVSKLGASLKKAMAGVSVAAGGALLAVKGIATQADTLAKTAQKIGIPTDELSRLQHAAELSGSSLGGVQTALSRLSRSMDEAKQGTASYKEAFDRLGIEVTDAQGNLRSTSDVLTDIAARFKDMPDGPEKTALAMELLGRSGTELIPLLNAGADGLQAMKDEADALGITISDGLGKSSEEFNDNLDRLGKAFTGLRVQLAEALIPVLSKLTGFLVGLAKGFSQLPGPVQTVIAVIGGLAAAATALGPALIGIGLIFGTLSAPILAVVAAVTAVTAAVVYFWPEIKQLGAVIIEFLAGAWEQFKQAWVTALEWIGALALAITEFVSGAWAQLQAAWDAGVAAMQRWLEVLLSLPALAIEAISAMVTAIVDLITNKLKAAWDSVTGSIEGVKQSFRDLYMAVVGGSYVPDMIDGIQSEFARLPGVMVSPAEGAANAVGDAFSKVADTVSGLLDKLLSDGKLTFDDLKSAALDLAKSLFIQPFFSALKGAFGGGGGLFGGGGGFGNLFAGMYADGGFIPAGQWGIAGEEGPEPVFGGRHGATVMPNESMGRGGTVVQNFNISTPDADSFRLSQRQISRMARQRLQV